ncbi:MAG: sodium:solute symporter family protein [Acidobacteriota bacterium]|nr:sodium:solute symporter family protein [Acidobacteriota bacterium]
MRPTLSPLDLAIIALYVVFALGIGSRFLRRAGRGVESFFVGDRKLPWWLAGTSIVATTFAADTPLAVTGIVAADGISGNWIWWSWAIAHLSATFFFARLWRRSGVITDAEITELRYGGRPAAALRVVKALYFGIFINCLTMAWVIAAMVKISRAFFDFEPAVVIAVCVAVSVTYTVLGGFRSVVITDLVQFALGMGGAVVLAVLVVQGFGGMGASEAAQAAGQGLLPALDQAVAEAGHRTVGDVLSLVPPAEHPTLPPIFFTVLLLAGWWRYAEGNGYIVQRLAACRDETQAQGASLWFSIAHNALRPWPWIVVALAALVVFPQLPGTAPDSLRATASGTGSTGSDWVAAPGHLDVAVGGEIELRGLPAGDCSVSAQPAGDAPAVSARRVERHSDRVVADFGSFPDSGFYTLEARCSTASETVPRTARLPGLRVELTDREMAYPLMMGRTLPSGLLGLVVASLLAAFMSTVDTHTNWGASYLVQDIYRRFLRPAAAERHYVLVSRLAIVAMAILAGVAALFVQDIAAVWRFLVTLGAGLGSVSAARWYWSRVTPWAELAAMAVTTVLAVLLELLGTPTLFGGPNPFFLTAVPGWVKILAIAGASLGTWIPVALLGPANDPATLQRFARRVRPPGPSWRPYLDGESEPVRGSILRFGIGLVVVFGSLAGIGDLVLGNPLRGLLLLAAAALGLFRILTDSVSFFSSEPKKR